MKKKRKSTAEKSSAVGDVAKLREALESCLDFITRLDRAFNPFMQNLLEDAIDNARAALAAPPRNCDRPECATSKAAQAVWRKEDGGRTGYHVWLLATATEKKGGNDAN